jgi:hypothetical protein
MNGRRKSDVLTIARAVIRRRGSARIIAIASARGDVRNLLTEYRGFISESERLLERDGIRLTGSAIELLREEWSDALIEHQQRTAPLRV